MNTFEKEADWERFRNELQERYTIFEIFYSTRNSSESHIVCKKKVKGTMMFYWSTKEKCIREQEGLIPHKQNANKVQARRWKP